MVYRLMVALMKSLVIANTIKGKGVSFMEGECQWHSKTMSSDDYSTAMEELR